MLLTATRCPGNIIHSANLLIWHAELAHVSISVHFACTKTDSAGMCTQGRVLNAAAASVTQLIINGSETVKAKLSFIISWSAHWQTQEAD